MVESERPNFLGPEDAVVGDLRHGPAVGGEALAHEGEGTGELGLGGAEWCEVDVSGDELQAERAGGDGGLEVEDLFAVGR
ncbi:MAG: hypothetical protein RI897_3298 [Verrucomicrobiota bacterium]